MSFLDRTMTWAVWSSQPENLGKTFAEYEAWKRKQREPAINRGAAFHPARLERDGETFAYQCIEIGGVQVYAYVQDGALVVSVDLDGAAGGVFDLYGGAEVCVPVTVNVGDTVVYQAGPPC